MCCVIPPDSPSVTDELLIKSRRDVLPWSTCPITVTVVADEFGYELDFIKTDIEDELLINLANRFIVTIIPRVMHVDIIWLELISISVAISPTVMNSVILIVLLSFSCKASSSSVSIFLWSLLSFLYLTLFDLEDLPWSFSKVSLICFFISSAVGSTFWEAVVGCLVFLLNLLAKSFGLETSLLILFLLFFLDSSTLSFTLSSFFLIESKSITSPVFFKPDSFRKFVWILDGSSGFTLTSVEDSLVFGIESDASLLGVSFFSSYLRSYARWISNR